MAGGIKETNPEKLAEHCALFMKGAKRLFDGERIKAMEGDMWLFELFHHLNDCADALKARAHAASAPQRLPDTGNRSD